MGQIGKHQFYIFLLVLIFLLSACGSAEENDAGEKAASQPGALVEAQPTIKPTTSAAQVVELPAKQPVEPESTAAPEPTITPNPTATILSPLAMGERSVIDYGIDLACLGTQGHGATCLNHAGEWQNFTQEMSPLGSDFIIDIDSCDDGTLLFLHGSGVSTFNGQEWREIVGDWGFDSPEAIACAGDDEFWVAHFRGISYFGGDRWFYIDSGNLSFGEEATELVKDVAVDDSGNVWIVTMNSITLYDGYGWVIYQLGQGFSEKYFFEAIAVDENGRPWVTHSHGLSTYEEDGWELIQNENLFSLQDVAVDQDGQKWIGTENQGLAVFDGSGWQIQDRLNGDLESDRINKIKVDEAGRIWAATAYGLHVFDGQSWHIYRMENADLADNRLPVLGISGTPRLPEPQEKEPGSISGSISVGNAPYSFKIIELCVEPLGSYYEGESPCSSQPFRRTEVTDSDGAFSFSGVPPGAYVLSLQTNDDWQQLTPESGFDIDRVLVVPGQNSDVGAWALSVDE